MGKRTVQVPPSVRTVNGKTQQVRAHTREMDVPDSAVASDAAVHAGSAASADPVQVPVATDGPESYFDAGDVGGNLQVSPSHMVSQIWGPVDTEDGPLYLSVEEYHYVEDAGEDEDGDQRFVHSEQVMWTVCTDPNDVGSTEVNREVEYPDGDIMFYQSSEEAETKAKQAVSDVDSDYFWHMDDVTVRQTVEQMGHTAVR